MKTSILFILIIVILTSCSSNKNSNEFIRKTTGRYYFNADEVIEVKFDKGELFLNWRDQDLTPLKVNDSTFYVRELNEKLIFNTTENNISLAKKREHKNETFVFKKLKEFEKTPSEYFNEGNYTDALKGYVAIKRKDSLNATIREYSLNNIGYQYLRRNQLKKAIAIFEINIALYPKSSNTYDSAGYGYLKSNDTLKAIELYKKALAINPENKGAKRNLKKLSQNN